MKGDVSLLKLTSNVSIFLGVMNFLINAILCNNSDMIIEEHIDNIYDVIPITYDVKLTLDQTKQRVECSIYFNGKCDIELTVNLPMNHITLNAHRSNIKIHSVFMFFLNKKDPMDYDVQENVYHIDEETNFVTIYFTRTLFGRYLLKLSFDSCLSDADVFKVSYTKKRKMSLLATHLLPTRARALFPCFDDLRLKADFNITLIVDKNYNTVSNARQSILYTGKVITISLAEVFNITTYDIAIVIYERSIFTYKNPIRYRREVKNHIEFAQTIVVNITEYLTNNWNISYILLPPSTFVIPGFLHDAVTKSGLNIYREEALLYKKGTDSFVTKLGVSRLIARTTAHEILSRFVSPNWWNNLWLNEGIGMLLGQHIVNKSFPELRLFDLFIVQFHQESLRLDVENIIGPIMPKIRNDTTINSLFSFSHYLKAPVILNVLRRAISDEIFWKGVQNYFINTTEASFDIFWGTMESTVEEANVRAEVPLTDVSLVMQTWTNQTHYHVLNIAQEINSSRIKIRTSSDTGLYLEHISLSMTTQSNLNFELNGDQVYGIWVEREGEYVFPYFRNPNKNDWIMFNSQQLGYFRIMYEEKNWRKIARYMDSDNYTNIPVLNRAQIMDDAFHFLMKGRMDLSIFLNLTNYLSREKDYVVWYPIFKGFEYISGYFPHGDSRLFKEKILIPLTKFFLTIRLSPTLNDHIYDCLREEISKWTCIFGSLYCKQISSTILKLEIGSSFSTSWKDWIYCKGLMNADLETWKQMFDIFLNESNNEMLRYLACSESSDIIIGYMDQITNNTKIRNIIAKKGIKTSINIFHSIVERHMKNTLILEYILDNFYYVIPREIGTMVALTDIINHIYLTQDLAKVIDFMILYNLQPTEWLTKKILIRTSHIYEQEQRFSNLKKMKGMT